MKTLTELIYAAAVGVAVALFVGFGIWALHPSPQYPEYPSSNYNYSEGAPSTEYQKEQDDYDKQFKNYENDRKSYAKEVAVIALVAAAVFYAVGLLFVRPNEVLREGLMFGGVFTSVYAIARATESEHRVTVFVAASFVLAMIVWLAHIKFRANTPRTKHK